MKEIKKLRFTKGNAYLPKDTYIFNLPSGYTCPGALKCLSFCDRSTGKLSDGARTVFRCYAATTERYPAVRRALWDNYDALREAGTLRNMTELILASLPSRATKIRVHVNGDFFSQAYFDAWLEVARSRPTIRFWAFTKSLPFWLARRGEVPDNFVLQASEGGKHDSLIAENRLKFARVVFSLEEAERAGLPVDCDDSYAMEGDQSFALPVHGQQPAKSEAAVAARELRAYRASRSQKAGG